MSLASLFGTRTRHACPPIAVGDYPVALALTNWVAAIPDGDVEKP